MNYSLAYRIGFHLRGAETRRAADEARRALVPAPLQITGPEP
jgi:hypothetical protein